MAKHISPSEIWVWKNNFEEWYSTYILGIKTPPNRLMLLGTAVHTGFEGKDWEQVLKENNFTANYNRTIKQILDNDLSKQVIEKFTEKECWLGKYGQEYPELGCKVVGRVDGKNDDEILEIKSGKSLWTQQRADESEQITLYIWLEFVNTGKMKNVLLHTCNFENGKVAQFTTSRTQEQINALLEEYRGIIQEMKQRGFWELRK